MNIGIYIYDEVEVLDFAGPFEVFTTAARVYERIYPDTPNLFNVFLIAENEGLVSARTNFKVQPDYTINEHPDIYALIVPGGIHAREMEKKNVIDWIANVSSDAAFTTSVCTGAFLLAKAGLLEGMACTTHWEDVDDLRAMFPTLDVKKDVPWVDNGQVVTSAGISAGIEMALHLITKLTTKEIAKLTARQMQYTWTNESLSQEQK